MLQCVVQDNITVRGVQLLKLLNSSSLHCKVRELPSCQGEAAIL